MKTILLGLLFLPFFGFTQTGTITGVVTYFFNDNLGNKPDIGASVYVVDTKIATLTALDSFNKAKNYRVFYQSALDRQAVYQGLMKTTKGKKAYKDSFDSYVKSEAEQKKKADELYKTLLVLNVESDSKFDSLDLYTTDMVNRVKNAGVAVSTVVDGTGNYSLKVKPGKYHVLIISSGRKGMSVTEINGQVWSKEVSINESDEIKNVSHNFTLY